MTSLKHHRITESATVLASGPIRGAEFRTDLYASWLVLYRTRNGHYVVRTHGSAAIADHLEYLDGREAAIDWIATEATDNVTGYGYTREQAEVMVDGGDAGTGYRGRD